MDTTQTTLAIVVLFVAGLLFFMLEIVTPMFGLLVALGLAAIGGAVWLCFTLSPVAGMVAVIAVVFVIPAYLALLVKLLPRSPLGRRLFLGRAPKAEAEATPEADRHESLVGQDGVDV